jgi:hypothetical protein
MQHHEMKNVVTPGGDALVSLNPVNKLPNVKFEDLYLGFFNGKVKFSYVVSAALHMHGFFQFWRKERQYWIIDKLFVTLDLVSHLACWIIPLILEIILQFKDNKGPEILAEVSMVSFWALVVGWIGIVLASFFALAGQEAGKLFPSIYAVIVGGAYTSIVMSLVWLLQSASWTAMVAQYDDSSLGDDLKLQRHFVLWAIALKICAVVCLKQNAAFWGPAIKDVRKEEEEKKAQFYKQNPGLAQSYDNQYLLGRSNTI